MKAADALLYESLHVWAHKQRMLGDRNSKGGRQTKFCLRVDMEQKQTIMHYQPQKSRTFLRIVVATPNLVTQARGACHTPLTGCHEEATFGVEQERIARLSAQLAHVPLPENVQSLWQGMLLIDNVPKLPITALPCVSGQV